MAIFHANFAFSMPFVFELKGRIGKTRNATY